LEGYYILALVFQHQGKIGQAVETMKKVIYIDRTDVLGHFSLACLYYNGGQISLALKSLENAHHILEKLPPDDLVPRSGEISAGRLLQTVIRQQQTWANALGGNHD
jgi:chemotaxis protein methyltransferase CheR